MRLSLRDGAPVTYIGVLAAGTLSLASLALGQGCGGGDASGAGGALGAGIPGGPISVASGGKSWEFRQGEILAQVQTANGQPALDLWALPSDFDRCSLKSDDPVTSDGARLHAAVPPHVGSYDIKDLGPVAIYAGLDLVIIDQGRLDVVAMDGAKMTVAINGSSSLNANALAGTIQVDTCGFTGQNLFTFESCTAPPSEEPGGYVPSLDAVSPGGRIAVAAGNNVLAVYARSAGADGSCTYRLDPAYGNAGMVPMPKSYRQSTFDRDERLYVTTNPGQGQPASISRIAPNAAAVSCRYNEQASAVVTDDAPDRFLVLPDGSAAYLAWRQAGEARLDLGSPSISDRDLPCDFVWSDGPAYYSDALSAGSDGLVFLRMLGDRTRAAITDLALMPIRYFGGTPSGAGEQGFADVRLMARCPAGYCAANGTALKVFAQDGQFVQMIRLASEFGQPFQVKFVGEGKNGDAYLRGPLGNGNSAVDVVYRMTPHS